MRFAPRALTGELRRAARSFAAVILTEPRRSGKTTLLRHVFPGASYHLLEDPDTVARVRADPRAFLDEVRPPVILDEIQHTQEILNYSRAEARGYEFARSSSRTWAGGSVGGSTGRESCAGGSTRGAPAPLTLE